MLQTLRNHDREAAERILSSLTSELLPDPEIYVPATFGVDPDLHSQVWNEIRRRVKVNPADTSPASQAKLLEFLFSEMSRIALPQSVVNSVRARLSERGELRPDLYDVKYTQPFGASEAHGVRRNHVLEAVRNANDVEHMSLLDGRALVSIFVRTRIDLTASNSFALLVVALRKGYELEVTSAFRIYRDEIDFSAASGPLDLLRLLVGKYGFSITIGHLTSKLMINEVTNLDRPQDTESFLKVHALEGSSIISDIIMRKLTLHGSWGVALAFALDQARYAAGLRRHGVHVQDLDFTRPHAYEVHM